MLLVVACMLALLGRVAPTAATEANDPGSTSGETSAPAPAQPPDDGKAACACAGGVGPKCCNPAAAAADTAAPKPASGCGCGMKTK